jgi:c-di-GMP-binding flagellar brake protein YcgR
LGREIDSAVDPETAEPHYAVHDLVDISAGGLRFASGGDFEPDEEIVCHFELPGSLCFVLPARIVLPSESRPTGSGKSSVAAEFVNLDENNRSQLLRWIYREQVQRYRDGLRKDPDG